MQISEFPEKEDDDGEGPPQRSHQPRATRNPFVGRVSSVEKCPWRVHRRIPCSADKAPPLRRKPHRYGDFPAWEELGTDDDLHAKQAQNPAQGMHQQDSNPDSGGHHTPAHPRPLPRHRSGSTRDYPVSVPCASRYARHSPLHFAVGAAALVPFSPPKTSQPQHHTDRLSVSFRQVYERRRIRGRYAAAQRPDGKSRDPRVDSWPCSATSSSSSSHETASTAKTTTTTHQTSKTGHNHPPSLDQIGTQKEGRRITIDVIVIVIIIKGAGT
mmetsp:Transcript_24889/g.44269  ORF Transcript_24889/g.44269 Transcript_24889/m.44269 type:complete len:270 (+) Transcript_24889:382-1191(+)